MNKKIIYTKKTPEASKKYLIKMLKDNDIEYKKITNGIQIKNITKEVEKKVDGYCFYCSMKEE